eukprot:CAMPEP_0202892552 /NCGR_PEP_ID=MMETSP1392-20130828/2271_1 /ASSEMBLY_ACC=CAM_ASM_000868 /TAXON_ID=225041 /ORGANISM="Chlamydomonas chlamydogama, Strain SAG 11-48b" /LENGTH=106 /DNA_ID=CAMNT_0049576545 /DNA_START=243 /DNA_END=563 /DNA_ORIENTATION=-
MSCLNIPGDTPSKVDPHKVVWPHSGGIPKAVSGKPWREAISYMCNTATRTFNTALYGALGCPAQAAMDDISMPLGVAMGPLMIPGYKPYAEVFECRIKKRQAPRML